jgi:hypothetical protein
VCLRDPDVGDAPQINTMTSTFQGAYNLKQVFADAAGYCMGE